LVEGIADAFASFTDRYRRFVRTRRRDCAAAAMATVVDASCPQQIQRFISNAPRDHEVVVRKSARTLTACWAASRPAA
jgi:hypothetical protein